MRPNRKFANASRIRTIDFAKSTILGTGSLSARARRTLAVYVILVKMGYIGISAPMGCIADAVHRSSFGEAKSIRTLQRANDELSEKGFIINHQFRPWEVKGALISFNLDAFTYWTKKPTENVQPLPTQEHNVVSRETMCDNSIHTTSCRASDRTRDNSRVDSPTSIPKKKEEPRAGARAINKSSRPKKNPVYFSVVCVLAKMRMYRAERKRARMRADIETRCAAAGIGIENHSGVDWAYWEKRWDTMPIAVRESTARREIIPYLVGKQTPCPPPDAHTAFEGPAPTAEEIRRVREQLEQKISLPPEESTPAPSKVETSWTGDESELAILLAAKRRINGM